ncbi:hypothetical protein V7968_31770 [Nocardia vulneris]|uniref:Uncharacterized protein n=1 Tax=Nocardia brasiliensis (strain ATCC 700358 / HUJEG-1) TaxID=1133849 RepID=K0F0Q7_NOCB7|nr:hypothetical protein [Nocardia brasiliensis]AFU02725.1 hypothetical protein O3I_023850 [Nocardia brasiliensis ATCC 700358]OCF85597.1 hypothetical protein AW168_35655 [Nocardia brasiliensis]
MIDDLSADAGEDDAPDWSARSYEVFNPDRTVGVACGRDGAVIGLHISDEACDNGDTWLAAEIVKLARLAHVKSRVGLRAEMEHKGTKPYAIDFFELPTQDSYRALERAEYGETTEPGR